MESAKLFRNGRSQAVRLPKEFRFQGDEVFIKKVPGGVLLMPKETSMWDAWEESLHEFDTPFPEARRQPAVQQKRDGLTDLFD